MKTKFFMVALLLLAGNFMGFSAELVYLQADGSQKKVSVEDDVQQLVLFDRENWKTVGIEGISQLKKLKAVEMQNLAFVKDFDFLKSDTIEELYVGSHSVTMSDFSFIESMTALKTIEINDVYITKDAAAKFASAGLDFSKLNKLEKVSFSLAILEGRTVTERMNFVPKFINVKNKPELDLSYAEIEHFSNDDVKILKQFGTVYLGQNPVVVDKKEMKKLSKAKINVK